MNKDDHVVTMQRPAVKLWVLEFKWILLGHGPPTETLLQTRYTSKN